MGLVVFPGAFQAYLPLGRVGVLFARSAGGNPRYKKGVFDIGSDGGIQS